MKLLTHNMLTSHVKGVTKGYPLLIKVNCFSFVAAIAENVKSSLNAAGNLVVSLTCLFYFCITPNQSRPLLILFKLSEKAVVILSGQSYQYTS